MALEHRWEATREPNAAAAAELHSHRVKTALTPTSQALQVEQERAKAVAAFLRRARLTAIRRLP